MLKQNSVAIIGATSHIAKGLIYYFLNELDVKLTLYARNLPKVVTFLKEIKCQRDIDLYEIEEFGIHKHDAVINCVGYGNPTKLATAMNKIFEITEQFDTLAIDYLKKSPDTLYINFSSGAVYGDFAEPARENSILKICPNKILGSQNYGISKLYSEVKHRSYTDLKIIDLRIFGYFSRFIDLDAGYLLSDVAKCILNKTVLSTYKDDIVRDYIHPEDLFRLIIVCMKYEKINCAIDVSSKKPVSKFEMLEAFAREFGLMYEVKTDGGFASPTGNKDKYYSENQVFQWIGFEPVFSSMDSLIKEMAIINNRNYDS